uniref:Uncharacterized protein n=1 Tax=Tetradesmus obliquus TaxID=3088 RepID=A0A383VVQ9_TETOB|eukprot:jgi/Sobl393_1/18246/SZX68953.1
MVASQDFSGAVKVLDEAIDETRQDYTAAQFRLVQLHLNRGICNQRLHLNRKALKDYDAVLALMPSNVNALLRKGQVLQSMGKQAEARVVWEAATSLADPASDLEVLLEIQAALAGNTSSSSTPAAAPSSPQPAPAATANGTTAAAAQELAPASAAAAIAEADGAAAAAEGASSSTAPAAAAAAPAAPSTSSSSQPKSKITKGFFSKASASDASSHPAAKSPAAAAANKAAPAAATAAPKAQPRGSSSARSSDSADAVVEIDCAAEQEQQQVQGVGGGAAAAGSFGAQVQQMATNSVALQIAINQINGGQVEQAEALLDSILASNPSDLSALVARGTARALARKLKEAVADFTKAIEIEPRYPDTYKRRGQARSALGDVQGALTDLEKAAQLLAELPGGAADAAGGPADCHAERGMLFHKQRDYRRAVKELAKATELDPSNAQAWNYLGLGRVSMGDIREGCKAYEKAIELAPQMKEAWLNLGQALKEEGRVKEAERALTKAMTSADGGACLAAYRLLATMRQGQGRQADAIKVLDKALGFKREDQRVELLYMRAICYHALGYARAALADYEACMNCKPRVDEGPAGEESRMFQFLSFYQREMALFTAHSLDRRAADFCLDSELTPLFKECWCKKGAPSPELFTSYKMQPALPAERSSGSGRGSSSGAEGGADAEQVAALTAAADVIGQLLQNHHQGFLPNVRQQRAAGYAAAELAQAVRALLAERAAGREGLWVNSEGASGQGGCSGRHLFGWRDAMDIVVKWRQLAEPADQVVWVDLLTPREFEAGFGSHTPMFSGQTKCVRYFMNFNRALELAKECLLEKGHAYDAQNREVGLGGEDKQEAVRKARSALELYRVIGQDSWVVVPLHSLHKAQQQQQQGSSAAAAASNGNTSSSRPGTSGSSRPGSSSGSSSRAAPKRISDAMVPPLCIEGTRLTLVKVPNQPDAVEFSIRTPVTPPRWREFDAELEAAWERLIDAMLRGDKPAAAAAILCYAYYWYNFMPLARGTAAVGYTTMLGLFWAAGMPISQPIPTDYQVDWEAILAKHPQQFIDRLSRWFVPEDALPVPPLPSTSASSSSSSSSAGASPAASPRGGSSSSSSSSSSNKVVAAAKALPDVQQMPAVAEVLATLRQRLKALNGPDAKPV